MASIAAQLEEEKRFHQYFPNFYLLEFNVHGQLTNPQEVNRAIRDINSSNEIENILIVSLGWQHNRDEIFKSYKEILNEYTKWKKNKICVYPVQDNNCIASEKWAVLAVSWESSLSAIGNFFADILPAADMAKEVTPLLGIPFQPLTYWSKARLADRIGLGELKDTVNEILKQTALRNKAEKTNNTPSKAQNTTNGKLNLFLLAHSFGSRIVTGLITPELRGHSEDGSDKGTPVSESPPSTPKTATAKINDYVRGVILIQPALSSLDIEILSNHLAKNNMETPPYPIIITESQYDHLNRLVYPMANILYNSSQSRMLDWILPSVVRDICQKSHYPESLSDECVEELGVATGIYDGLYVVPVTIASSVGMTLPLSYLTGQAKEIRDRGILFIPDTLAQIPILEIPIDWINHIVEPKNPEEIWGGRHKGAFYLGPILESASTLITANHSSDCAQDNKSKIYTTADFLSLPCLPTGIIPIDASDSIFISGLFTDRDLHDKLNDYTIGWFDPLGAHTDYLNPDIFSLIFKTFSQDTKH